MSGIYERMTLILPEFFFECFVYFKIKGIKTAGQALRPLVFASLTLSRPKGRGIIPFVPSSLGRCESEYTLTRSSLAGIKFVLRGDNGEDRAALVYAKPAKHPLGRNVRQARENIV